MNLKKVLTLGCMLLLVAASAFSQENPDWYKQIEDLQTQANQYIQQKDWKKSSDCMEKIEKVFYSQSEEEREKYYFGRKELTPNFYYNYTCYLSLSGKTSKALKAFERFTKFIVNKEYEADLSHINTDSDLDPIRNDKRFIDCMNQMKPIGDYLQKLKDASSYWNGSAPESIKFRYMSPNDTNLVFLRQHYKLDSVAGSGDEISKIKNLLHWIHEAVTHDGSSFNPEVKNTHAMIELCKKENRGVNCRMMAQMLAEVYLAMGFKARFVSCIPRDFINDSHVITTVYSCTLDKWVWVDPTFDAFVTDENGTMLSISEVRSRLRNGEELQLNDYANWNHRSKQTKEHYLYYYMAKNLYYLNCMEESRFNAETYKEGQSYRYFILMPQEELDKEIKAIGTRYIRFADEDWFWQSPYEK